MLVQQPWLQIGSLALYRPTPHRPCARISVLFQLLREAIDILDGSEPTKDQRGEIHRAIELLNRLIKLMRNRDTNSYPTGSLGRITEARHALNIISHDHSEFIGARKALKAVLCDWDVFWLELEG